MPYSYFPEPPAGDLGPDNHAMLSGLWVVPVSDRDREPEPLAKPATARLFLGFDFGNAPEIAAGAVIEDATISVSPSGPTVGDLRLLGSRGEDAAPYRAAAWFSGGSAGTDYAVTCTATLDSGAVLVGTGILRVV